MKLCLFWSPNSAPTHCKSRVCAFKHCMWDSYMYLIAMPPSRTNKLLAVHSITMVATVREFWYTFEFWQVATASFMAGQSWSFTSETASWRDFDRIWGLRAKGQARGFPLEGRISLCVCKRESSLERYASILFRETLHTTAVLCTTYHIHTPYLHQKI